MQAFAEEASAEFLQAFEEEASAEFLQAFVSEASEQFFTEFFIELSFAAWVEDTSAEADFMELAFELRAEFPVAVVFAPEEVRAFAASVDFSAADSTEFARRFDWFLISFSVRAHLSGLPQPFTESVMFLPPGILIDLVCPVPICFILGLISSAGFSERSFYCGLNGARVPTGKNYLICSDPNFG